MYIVIAGGGKVGEYLATVLLESGNEVAIIELDQDVADRLSMVLQGRYLVICGDGCDSRYQEDAGIREADVFVAATGKDDNNLVSCEIASRVFEVPRCVARVNAPKNQRIFRTLGIESISSTEMIASLIEEEMLLGSVSVVSSLTHGDVILVEVAVPHGAGDPDGDGIAAFDLPMPEGSLIVAVGSNDDMEVVGEETRLYPGDTVVVAADRDQVGAVRALFRDL